MPCRPPPFGPSYRFWRHQAQRHVPTYTKIVSSSSQRSQYLSHCQISYGYCVVCCCAPYVTAATDHRRPQGRARRCARGLPAFPARPQHPVRRSTPNNRQLIFLCHRDTKHLFSVRDTHDFSLVQPRALGWVLCRQAGVLRDTLFRTAGRPKNSLTICSTSV